MAKQQQRRADVVETAKRLFPSEPRAWDAELVGIGVAQLRPGTTGWIAYKTTNRGTTEVLSPPKKGVVGEDKFRALARAKSAFIETFVSKGLVNKMRVR